MIENILIIALLIIVIGATTIALAGARVQYEEGDDE